MSRLLCCAPRCFHFLFIRLSLWSFFLACLFWCLSLWCWMSCVGRRHVSKLPLLLSFRSSIPLLLVFSKCVSFVLVRVVAPSSKKARLSRERTEINMMFTYSLQESFTFLRIRAVTSCCLKCGFGRCSLSFGVPWSTWCRAWVRLSPKIVASHTRRNLPNGKYVDCTGLSAAISRSPAPRACFYTGAPTSDSYGARRTWLTLHKCHLGSRLVHINASAVRR